VMFEFGKRVKANIQPLPKKEAERVGRVVADKTLSASFKVTKSKTQAPASRRSKLVKKGDAPLFKFRPGRTAKTKGFTVEKSKFRLDSPGEVKGITASRFIANKKKRFMKLFTTKKKQKPKKRKRKTFAF